MQLLMQKVGEFFTRMQNTGALPLTPGFFGAIARVHRGEEEEKAIV